MKKLLTIRAVWTMLVILAVSAPASATITYLLDDGTFENAVRVIGGGQMWWANAFEAQPGGQLITSIEIVFGTLAGDNGLSIGESFDVLLYNDIDTDWDPATGLVYLTGASATVLYKDAVTFQSVDIPDTMVSGVFFVGATTTHDAGQWPGSIDQTTSALKSWFASPDPYTDTPYLIDNYGIPGNWGLRATGVPEPATVALLGLGALSLIRRKRRA